jgi:N-acetyl-beta-hexosaminidase
MIDDMYSVLGQIYDEYFDIFNFDSFHFGGDEVKAAAAFYF